MSRTSIWVRQLLDEADRLRALHALAMLDTPPDEKLDRLTVMAAGIFNAPIALVTLVDEDRQWFKANLGLAARETPRNQAFCAHTIREQRPFIVLDASRDPRFVDNPLVTGPPDIRFYAGVPLITEAGAALGSLCVIDRESRHSVRDEDVRALEALTLEVVQQIELLGASSGLGNCQFDLSGR